jgi:hypothetical protein
MLAGFTVILVILVGFIASRRITKKNRINTDYFIAANALYLVIIAGIVMYRMSRAASTPSADMQAFAGTHLVDIGLLSFGLGLSFGCLTHHYTAQKCLKLLKK